MWKMEHSGVYLPEIKKMEVAERERSSRSVSSVKLIEDGSSNISQMTFINDATRAWNKAPSITKSSNSVYSAKKAIKCFVKTLPV